MRGAPRVAGAPNVATGIIPADAGSTCFDSRLKFQLRDHPRGCGEHTAASPRPKPHQGSSPRMRGAHDVADPVHVPAGIIPADAGSTFFRSRIGLWPRDHPRGCGEHHAWLTALMGLGGSSPRMRGALMIYTYRELALWIIPADARSTQRGEPRIRHHQDHPRGCGEHPQT